MDIYIITAIFTVNVNIDYFIFLFTQRYIFKGCFSHATHQYTKYTCSNNTYKLVRNSIFF